MDARALLGRSGLADQADVSLITKMPGSNSDVSRVQTEGMAEDDAFAIEARIGMEVFMSADAQEGPRAFAEKRRPDFRGR